jgi:DNA mismatch endonuclease (patch repair protein)
MPTSSVPKIRKAGHRRWAAGNQPVPGTHTGDIVPPHVRSQVMARIRGKDTGPEIAMATALLKKQIRMERHARDLPGCPDFVNRRRKLAVFIDGNFWHGWRFPLWKHKLSPKWQLKIEGTRKRDQRNFARLRRNGWRVLRIWEHQIERDTEVCAMKIQAALKKCRALPL